MVRWDRQMSTRRAAALQCLAERFRAEARAPAAGADVLRYFAATLDAMAASLLVPPRPPHPVATAIALDARARCAPAARMPRAEAATCGSHE